MPIVAIQTSERLNRPLTRFCITFLSEPRSAIRIIRGGATTLIDNRGIEKRADHVDAEQVQRHAHRGRCNDHRVERRTIIPTLLFLLGAATAQIDLKDNAPNTSLKPLA